MKVQDIIFLMEQFAPNHYAEKWDNCGLQIGNTDNDVKRILLALDVTNQVMSYALENNFDMIITHHPFIFNPLKSIKTNTSKGALIKKAIVNEIAIFSAHTNLDACKNGVSDTLIGLFDVDDVSILDLKIDSNNQPYGIGRIGNLLKEMSLQEFANVVKNKLGNEYIRIYGDIDSKVKRIAVVGGSGADFMANAKEKGADVIVTGDVRSFEAQYAEEIGLAVIDAEHYYTEKVILEMLKEYLGRKNNEIYLEISDKDNNAIYKLI